MNQIEIMRHDPVVTCDGTATRIMGRQRELFRLLILYNGKTVNKETIALLRDTSVTTAASKVRYLRGQLASAGCAALIETDRSNGYRAMLRGWHVDAQEFCAVIEPLDGAFNALLRRTINEDDARVEVKKLGSALNLWHGNPAVGLPSEEGLEAKFDVLKRKAEDRLLMARLCTRQHSEIREAIQELEHRSRSAADDLVWELLLLAYHALGSVGQVNATLDRIARHYNGRTPSKLEQIVIAFRSGNSEINPFRVDDAVSHGLQLEPKATADLSRDDQDSLRALCVMLGITTASQLRLEGSHLTPLACIRRTRTRLYFSGVLASKWVIDPAVRSEFNQLLSPLDANNGEARFLVINPNADGFRRLCELRKGHISTESVEPLRRLAFEHRCLHVRVYNSLPAFRIVVIDDDVVSFSPYRLAADAYVATDRG